MSEDIKTEEVERQRGGNRPRREPKSEDVVAAAPEERRTRRSRLSSGTDEMDVPKKYRQPEMDYQWWTVKVLNQEIDPSDHVTYAEGGWEPVRPEEMPDMVPRGYSSNTIDRRGLRLYKRPMYLTEEARAEDYSMALAQKQAKISQAMSQPGDSAPRVGQKIDISTGNPILG